MKIAFIGQKGIPSVSGGVETHAEKLAVKLAGLGHEVFVYVRNNYTDKKIKEYKGVKLISLPSIQTKHLDAISHTFLATVHALFQNYDVIHYQAIGPASLSWIVKLFKKKTALVATFHCQDYYHQKWGMFARACLRFGEFVICKIPDKTIVVSKTLRNYALEKYGLDSIFIPNGAEVKRNPQTDILADWGIKEKKYILSVSRLIKHKGIHYLIEAFKQLEDTNKLPNNFKLVIVGDGYHTDDYVRYLKTISEKRNNIIFTGNQTGKPLEQLFSHAYLFVQPSESEGLSISLLEAMGYGISPLVSDIKENMEVVVKSGFSFQSKNVQDLKDKMAYLLNRPNEVQRISKAAKEKVEKEYSWDSIAQKTVQVYESAINKHSTRSYVRKFQKI